MLIGMGVAGGRRLGNGVDVGDGLGRAFDTVAAGGLGRMRAAFGGAGRIGRGAALGMRSITRTASPATRAVARRCG